MVKSTFGGLLLAEGTGADDDFDGLLGHVIWWNFEFFDIEFALYYLRVSFVLGLFILFMC